MFLTSVRAYFNVHLFVSGSTHQLANHFSDVSRGTGFCFCESLSYAVRKVVVSRVRVTTNTMDEILKGDAMYLRAFEKQAILDADESNQSPTEANKSNEMLVEARLQTTEYLIQTKDRTNIDPIL